MTNPKLKEEEKQFLLGLTNLASKQFAEGLDPTVLMNYVTSFTPIVPLTPACDLVKNGLPGIPSGLGIKSLPLITGASGGVFGFWVLGGEPGVGKSTLAWQIALSVGQKIPVLAYDMENGQQGLLYRTSTIFGRDTKQITSALAKIYIRENINTLESDVLQLKPPCLILVDSLQKLPTNLQQRRGSLDKWINRLETLAKNGYSVLMVSEVSRQNYGQPSVGGFKETGEIEYSASFGVRLLKHDDGSIGFYVVKNRHRAIKTAFTASLVRDEDKTFWYKEI